MRCFIGWRNEKASFLDMNLNGGKVRKPLVCGKRRILKPLLSALIEKITYHSSLEADALHGDTIKKSTKSN